MAYIEWSDNLSVGFDEMDEDHRKLVELANSLHVAIDGGFPGEEISMVFAELVSYTQWHFRHEERLMQQAEYHGLEAHKKEHTELTAKVLALQASYHEGDISVPDRLMPFLREWLAHHIQEVDRETGQYLAKAS